MLAGDAGAAGAGVVGADTRDASEGDPALCGPALDASVGSMGSSPGGPALADTFERDCLMQPITLLCIPAMGESCSPGTGRKHEACRAPEDCNAMPEKTRWDWCETTCLVILSVRQEHSC